MGGEEEEEEDEEKEKEDMLPLCKCSVDLGYCHDFISSSSFLLVQ